MSLFLMLAGYGQYNLQWNVPAESMGPLFPERMSLLQRLMNPYLKRQIPKGMSAIFLPPRNAVRAGLGLSPLTGGPSELEGRAPRVLYMDGITWDLVSGIVPAVCCTAWDSVLVHGWSRTCSCGTSPTTITCNAAHALHRPAASEAAMGATAAAPANTAVQRNTQPRCTADHTSPEPCRRWSGRCHPTGAW